MKEIVKVLLQEGIDEETIHEVLAVIEENYEIVDEEIRTTVSNLKVPKFIGRKIHGKRVFTKPSKEDVDKVTNKKNTLLNKIDDAQAKIKSQEIAKQSERFDKYNPDFSTGVRTDKRTKNEVGNQKTRWRDKSSSYIKAKGKGRDRVFYPETAFSSVYSETPTKHGPVIFKQSLTPKSDADAIEASKARHYKKMQKNNS